MTAPGSRFPFPAFPIGWFRIADTQGLRPGEVRAVKALGQDLVLTRGQDGVARAFDAHCPHLGAHLGVGGRLLDGVLQCPFHGWRFDSGGACLGAAGGRRTPAARLRAWPTREWCGAILVYHDPEAAEPAWDLPAGSAGSGSGGLDGLPARQPLGDPFASRRSSRRTAWTSSISRSSIPSRRRRSAARNCARSGPLLLPSDLPALRDLRPGSPLGAGG